MVDNKMKFVADLNKMFTSMTTAIRSMYSVRHLIQLKAGVALFKSQVLPNFNFGAIFLRRKKQIILGINVCHMRKAKILIAPGIC